MTFEYFRLRLTTDVDAMNKKIDRNFHLFVFFKGEHGVTSTLKISSNQFQNGIYQKKVALENVGNVNVDLKLDHFFSNFIFKVVRRAHFSSR